MDTSDIRKNLKMMLDGNPYVVVDFQFVKPGKGQPFTRCKLRNIMTGASISVACRKFHRRVLPATGFPRPGVEW